MDFLGTLFIAIYIFLALVFIGALVYFIYEKISGKEKEDFEDREN